MNLEYMRQFYERSGYKVIKSKNFYWLEMSNNFYQAMPPSGIIEPEPAEIQELFRKHRIWGLKYSTKSAGLGQEGYLYCCYDKTYDFKNMGASTRRNMRKALKKCSVEPIDFDYLAKEGFKLNTDTLGRQKRHDPAFLDYKRWSAMCRAGKDTAGAEVWGTLVDGKLASYMIAFQVGKVFEILHLMSRSDFRAYYPNYALLYTVLNNVLNKRPEVVCVCGGTKSIRPIKGVNDYKLRVGFDKKPANFVVILNPWLKFFLLNKLSQLTFQGMFKLFPKNDRVRLAYGMVGMAHESGGFYK